HLLCAGSRPDLATLQHLLRRARHRNDSGSIVPLEELFFAKPTAASAPAQSPANGCQRWIARALSHRDEGRVYLPILFLQFCPVALRRPAFFALLSSITFGARNFPAGRKDSSGRHQPQGSSAARLVAPQSGDRVAHS